METNSDISSPSPRVHTNSYVGSSNPTFEQLSTGKLINYTTARPTSMQSNTGPSCSPQLTGGTSPPSSPHLGRPTDAGLSSLSHQTASPTSTAELHQDTHHGRPTSHLSQSDPDPPPVSLSSSEQNTELEQSSASHHIITPLQLLNTRPGPSSTTQPNTAASPTSSSPQLLGILNTPPKSARPHPYQRQLSGSKVTEPQSSQLKLQVAKPHTIPNIVASPMVMPIFDQRPTPILQNVVGTANLGCELNLWDINCRTRNSEYNPQRFSGIVMRIREPHTTSLIFHSGKMVVTGAKSEAECLLAARKFGRICQRVGNNVQFKGFRVTNMVATCDLKFPIRVENLNMTHGQFSSYEPELFPGLVYRMVCPRVVILVFVNGKLCFTGAKSVEELHMALENIYPILKSFRKQ